MNKNLCKKLLLIPLIVFFIIMLIVLCPGQRMRAEIATSLIHRPKIIFLDEPTIGLDVISKKKLRDLFVCIVSNKNISLLVKSKLVVCMCPNTVVRMAYKIYKSVKDMEFYRWYDNTYVGEY